MSTHELQAQGSSVGPKLTIREKGPNPKLYDELVAEVTVADKLIRESKG